MVAFEISHAFFEGRANEETAVKARVKSVEVNIVSVFVGQKIRG
jgi:hypothetical protein